MISILDGFFLTFLKALWVNYAIIRENVPWSLRTTSFRIEISVIRRNIACGLEKVLLNHSYSENRFATQTNFEF
jgi:hypothetical protein